MKSGIWISTLAMLLAGQGLAQDPLHVPDMSGQDSTGRPRFNLLGVNLERNLNTFDWTGRVHVDTAAMGTILKMNEQYTSNVILLDGGSSSSNLRSDQQNLSLLVERPVAHALLSEVRWSSIVYSDNKSVGLGHSSFHSVLGGVEYSPIGFLELNPLLGYRWDNQAGVKDKGLSYTLGARTESLDMDGYQLQGNAQFHEDRLNPRLLQRHVARIGAEKYFSANSRDSLQVGYSRNRSEFYAVAEGNIESRTEDILSITNLLDYEIEPQFGSSFFVRVADRSLGRDIRHYAAIRDTTHFNTAIDEFQLEAYYELTYRSQDGGILASARLAYDERNEQHSAQDIPQAPPSVENLFTIQNGLEKTKNNLTRRTSLTSMLHLPFSASDTLLISGATSILRYDTPSDLDPAARVDRDELLIALSVSTVHRISRYFDLAFDLEGNLNHIVYLFHTKSDNNRYNRVLRFSPSATFRPTREITSTNIFEVLANYTVYDYEQIVSDRKGDSYRQFGWMDSSSVEFSRRIGLDFLGHLKLYERGQLSWSDFSERTQNSYVDRTVSSQVRFCPEEGLLFALGIRYFSQTRYSYETGVKSFDSLIQSLGPTCLILWDVGVHSRIMFKGWYERRSFSGGQAQSAGLTQTLPNLTMNIFLNL